MGGFSIRWQSCPTLPYLNGPLMILYIHLVIHENFSLDVPILKLFLAILLLSGYVPLPRRPMYWEANGDVHNIMVSGAMSLNRFSSIIGNIHFANTNVLDGNDKFAKVRPLLDSINAAWLANFHPEQMLSVDESMVPYYGRHGAKQYIHGKPIKFGYKIWVLATRLGYAVYNTDIFMIYMASEDQPGDHCYAARRKLHRRTNQPLTQKRNRNPSAWKSVKRRTLHQSGQAYISSSCTSRTAKNVKVCRRDTQAVDMSA